MTYRLGVGSTTENTTKGRKHMELTGTVSVIEVIWTLFCVIGLIYSLKLMGRSATDLFAIRIKKINSIREYAAITTVILFVTLTLVQFLFVLIGVVAMLAEQSTSGSRTGYVVAALFIFVSFMLDVSLYTVEKRRSALVKKIAEIEDMGEE